MNACALTSISGRRSGALGFLDAEIRRGRSPERKRAFGLATMEYAAGEFDIPEENLKIVFTEHPGASMMGINRVGDEWGREQLTDDFAPGPGLGSDAEPAEGQPEQYPDPGREERAWERKHKQDTTEHENACGRFHREQFRIRAVCVWWPPR